MENIKNPYRGTGKFIIGGKGCTIKVHRDKIVMGIIDTEFKVRVGDIIQVGRKFVKII